MAGDDTGFRWSLVWALTLLAVMGGSIARMWQDARQQGEAATTAQWLGIRSPRRASRTPGVDAWLRTALLRAEPIDREREVHDEALSLSLRTLLSSAPGLRVPEELERASATMRNTIADCGRTPTVTNSVQQRRWSERLEREGVALAATGSIVREGSSSDRRVQRREECSSLLVALAEQFEHSVALPRFLRWVRVYAVAENGDFISLPAPGRGAEPPEEVLRHELAELAKNPEVPVFGSQEFFFDGSGDGLLRFSGPYLDLGGSGLVCSLMADAELGDRSEAVVAVDFSFDLDWTQIAHDVEAPLLAHRVHGTAPAHSLWQPWSHFERIAPSDLATPIRDALAELALQERRSNRDEPRSTVHHAAFAGGTLAALQVSADDWLLLCVPDSTSRAPVAALVLCASAFVLLFLRSERNRRSAQRARARALEESAEREHLLETMQVPLVVVDPNNDEIAFCNRAASDLGIAPRQRFGADVVARDPAAQEHYRSMQTLDGRPRRAYGVPLRYGPPDRYAIVRSVAVTAPIASLCADQRHRLGVLFLLEEEADLGFFLQGRLESERAEERARLSSLLDHGLDRISRAVASLVEDSPELGAELAHLLSRRVEAISWILEHWGRPAPQTFPVVVDRAQVEHALQRLERWFRTVRDHADLRRRLGWNNGTLSADSVSGEVLCWTLDWPASFAVPMPAEGLFGFLLDECLVNAVRHGTPGSIPNIEVEHDAGRCELRVTIANPVDGAAAFVAAHTDTSRSYRGTALVDEVARAARFTRCDRHREHGEHVQVLWMNAVRIHARVDRE